MLQSRGQNEIQVVVNDDGDQVPPNQRSTCSAVAQACVGAANVPNVSLAYPTDLQPMISLHTKSQPLPIPITGIKVLCFQNKPTKLDETCEIKVHRDETE